MGRGLLSSNRVTGRSDAIAPRQPRLSDTGPAAHYERPRVGHGVDAGDPRGRRAPRARVQRRAGRVDVVDEQDRRGGGGPGADHDPPGRAPRGPARARLAGGAVVAARAPAPAAGPGGPRARRRAPRPGRTRAPAGAPAARARARRPRGAARPAASPRSAPPSAPATGSAARNFSACTSAARGPLVGHRRPRARERRRRRRAAAAPVARQAAARAAPAAQPRQRAQAAGAQQLVRPARAARGTPRRPAGRRSRAARRGRGGSCAEPAAGARADHRASVTIPCLVRRHFVDLRADRPARARGLPRRLRRALAHGAARGRRPGGGRLAARGLVRRRRRACSSRWSRPSTGSASSSPRCTWSSTC